MLPVKIKRGLAELEFPISTVGVLEELNSVELSFIGVSPVKQ